MTLDSDHRRSKRRSHVLGHGTRCPAGVLAKAIQNSFQVADTKADPRPRGKARGAFGVMLNNGLRALHREMIVCASLPEECAEDVIITLRHVQALANSLIPGNTEAHLYGSQATGLAVKDSDIDIVILSGLEGEKVSKDKMKDALKKLASSIECKVTGGRVLRVENTILDARVPIIKCRNFAGRSCDISFGVRHGLIAINSIKEKMKMYPSLRPLILVLKQILKSRDLNDLGTGGLSSYALMHLVLSVVSTSGSAVVRKDGLGGLLIHFLEFYGLEFDPANMVIDCKGVCVRDGNSKTRLIVLDMMDSSTELAKGSHQFREVLNVFASAAQALTSGVFARS